MITLNRGLTNSLIVLELLRNDEELEGVYISVGTFTNCRECGLTFMVHSADYKQFFTFCIYEHRNSDSIIINGKPGMVSLNGDLPYAADDKYTYLAEFGYNHYYECAVKLREMIVSFYKMGELPKRG